uniref:Uncharacterized protein n=1 Tax=Anguilla anguilla TaxID=7936 RepID=A0A0E9R914_ANGAN
MGARGSLNLQTLLQTHHRSTSRQWNIQQVIQLLINFCVYLILKCLWLCT